MKKLLSLIMAMAMTISFVACQSTDDTAEAKVWDSSELETMLQTVADTTEYSSEEYKEFVELNCQAYELPAEMEEYNLGSTELVYSRAVMFEPMMSSQAFSLAMFTTETAQEATTLAETLPTTVNPAKWVCVSVEEDDIIAVANGNLVFLVMAEDAQNFVDAFDAMVNEG